MRSGVTSGAMPGSRLFYEGLAAHLVATMEVVGDGQPEPQEDVVSTAARQYDAILRVLHHCVHDEIGAGFRADGAVAADAFGLHAAVRSRDSLVYTLSDMLDLYCLQEA